LNIFSRDSVKIGKTLLERARASAAAAGYSSVEEFVAHCVEKELAGIEEAEARDAVVKQLKGLGYLE
jgi:hypothetical protein